MQALAHLLNVQADVVAVQKIGRLNELRLGMVHLGVDHPVLHIAVGRDDDDQHTALGQAQKLHVPKGRGAARRNHHAHELRQAREQVGGIGDDFLRLVRRQDVAAKLLRLHRKHGVHEQPVAARRGHAPGRGVGADDQSHLFQV